MSSEHVKDSYWSDMLRQEISASSGGSGGMVLTSSDSDSSCSTEIDVEREAERAEEERSFIVRRRDLAIAAAPTPESSPWWNVSTPRAEIVDKGGWREVMGSMAVPWDRGEKELPTLEEAAVLFGFRKN